MNTTVLLMAGTLCAGSLLAQNRFPGYSISVTPAETVADSVGGEETYVRWEIPLGAITLADFIGFYRLSESGGQELIWFKQEILRGGDSQYIFTNPGRYKVSYMHFSFFQYYETALAPVSVRPTLSLVPNARNYPPRSGPVVAFGDSLTEGRGATRSNMVDWLEAFTGLPIINAGKSGDTTADARVRLNQDVLRHNPSMVLVLLGGNDLLDQLPTTETFSNLHQIVFAIQNAGAVTLVIGIYGGIVEDRYREEFHELYTSTRSVFVPDILKGIVGNPFLTEGAVHPDDEGYRRMALRLAPLVNGIMGTRLIIRPEGNRVIVQWFGNTNTTYDLLSSTILNMPRNIWSVLRTVEGANDLVSISLSRVHSQQFFALGIRKE